MPLISITFHSCFLSIIYARASYLANELATETSTLHISAYTSLPSTTMYLSSTLLSRRQCAYASLGCDKKKITLYRNFFRNLNFKNTVNFFKRTCWYSISVADLYFVPLVIIENRALLISRYLNFSANSKPPVPRYDIDIFSFLTLS